jgi:hypothetical protein
MAEIFHARFDSGLDSFSAGTRVTTKGSAEIADVDGCLEIGAGVTANRDFTNITTGLSRLDFHYRVEDSSVAASSSTLVYAMANGIAPASGTSLCTIALSRFDSSSGSQLKITYRDNAGAFVPIASNGSVFEIRRGAWWVKMGIVLNHTAKTFDLYVEDILYVRGAPWPNNAAAGFGRVSIVSQASAPSCWFDNILVQDAWSEGETTLINHNFVGGSGEIEASTPTTSIRQTYAQPWFIAPDTTYGAFTLGSNGAAPDTSKKCLSLQRCAANGIIEIEFRTSVAGVAYFGMLFRFWDYPSATGAGAGVFRVSGSGNTAVLIIPDRLGALQTVASASFTPTANTTYTLKLEMRGRYYIGSIKAATIDSGSYTVLFTHAADTSLKGGRGMLIEELCGPFVDTTIGANDNYVRQFRFTGKNEPGEVTKTIGQAEYSVGHGSIKELYFPAAVSPNRNIFWSRGIQYGHRSSADMCGNQQKQVIYNTTNVYATRQTGANITEYEHLGKADCYVTLLRRGPWVSDSVTPFATTENFAPDFDLLPQFWDTNFRTAISTGVSIARNDSPYHDWIGHNSNVALPAGNQSLTAFGSGNNYLVNQIVIPDVSSSGSVFSVTSKFEGSGDPISRAVSTSGSNLTAGGRTAVSRAFLVKQASALSDSVLTNWRDDIKTPATLSFSTGSAKTNAEGDTNTDGFNERHGWYEIQCASGDAAWTLPVPSGTRYMPVFRLHGFTTKTVISVNGTPATENTDYTLDTVESGIVVLQMMGDYSANTTFALSEATTEITGTLAGTEIGNDTFSASGTQVATGAIAATETGSDIFSASGGVIVSGSLATSETGSDTFSASGTQVSTGSLAATEQNDTFQGSGAAVSSGSLAATETGSDTFSASGTQVSTGTLAATEQNDTFQGSGAEVSSGALAATEAGADTFASTGSVLIEGSLQATEQPDTFSASGNVVVSGTLSVSETGQDVFTGFGGAVIAGTLSATETGSDTLAASGTQVSTGDLAASEQSDTFSATGNVIVNGTLAVTEEPDTFSASGSIVITGSFAATEIGLDVFRAYDPGSSPSANEADLQWSILVKAYRHQSLVKQSKNDILIK